MKGNWSEALRNEPRQRKLATKSPSGSELIGAPFLPVRHLSKGISIRVRTQSHNIGLPSARLKAVEANWGAAFSVDWLLTLEVQALPGYAEPLGTGEMKAMGCCATSPATCPCTAQTNASAPGASPCTAMALHTPCVIPPRPPAQTSNTSKTAKTEKLYLASRPF
eukprot:scaffold5204_cov296-Pinguiococcus_pyrenoidosus.AAC.3